MESREVKVVRASVGQYSVTVGTIEEAIERYWDKGTLRRHTHPKATPEQNFCPSSSVEQDQPSQRSQYAYEDFCQVFTILDPAIEDLIIAPSESGSKASIKRLTFAHTPFFNTINEQDLRIMMDDILRIHQTKRRLTNRVRGDDEDGSDLYEDETDDDYVPSNEDYSDDDD